MPLIDLSELNRSDKGRHPLNADGCNLDVEFKTIFNTGRGSNITTISETNHPSISGRKGFSVVSHLFQRPHDKEYDQKGLGPGRHSVFLADPSLLGALLDVSGSIPRRRLLHVGTR